MPSKVERLDVIDELATPDLWPDIRQREPSGEPEGPGQLLPARRLVAAIVALSVAAAGSLVAVRAFTGDEPNRPPTAPGAARIVFSGGGGDAHADLFSMNPDGSDVRQLTDTPGSEEQPAPSPDGSRLAFAVREPGDPTSYVIGAMDADGANRGEIAGTRLEPRNPVGDPAWSPDGSEIAFAAYGDGGGIYIAGVSGGRPRRLTSAGPPTIHVDSEPVWSPNGDAIAFIRWFIGDSDEPPAFEILEVSPSGGHATLIDRFPAPTQGSPDDNGEVRGLSWSPDGSQLAFATEGAILTIDADGGQPRELVSCEELGCDRGTDVFTDSTTWSFDGRRIAFTAWVNVSSARADPPVIYIATVSGDPATVTSTDVGGLFPAWQPVPAESEPSPSSSPPTILDFEPAPGWHVVTTDPSLVGSLGAQAWASNVPFTEDEESVGESNSFPDGWPDKTEEALPPDGIILVASYSIDSRNSLPPGRSFPERVLPLTIDDRPSTAYEGQDPDRALSVVNATVNGRYVSVRIVFGTGDPGPELVGEAQAELGRLIVAPPPETVSALDDFGLRMDLPDTWHGILFRWAVGEPTIHAATVPITDLYDGSSAREGLGPEDLFLVLSENHASAIHYEPVSLPVVIRPEDACPTCEILDNGTSPPPGHALFYRSLAAVGRQFDLFVEFGTSAPSAEQLARVNEVLATLEIDPPDNLPPPAESPLVAADAAVSVDLAAGWIAKDDPVPSSSAPHVVAAYGTWDFPTGGNCGPEPALGDLPTDGALVWVAEYADPGYAVTSTPLVPGSRSISRRRRLDGSAPPPRHRGCTCSVSPAASSRSTSRSVPMRPRRRSGSRAASSRAFGPSRRPECQRPADQGEPTSRWVREVGLRLRLAAERLGPVDPQAPKRVNAGSQYMLAKARPPIRSERQKSRSLRQGHSDGAVDGRRGSSEVGHIGQQHLTVDHGEGAGGAEPVATPSVLATPDRHDPRTAPCA